jgi:hypothetical protein
MLVLNQSNSFVSYAAQKVIKLADSNPNDISRPDLIRLKLQLKIFVDDMRKKYRFKCVYHLGELSNLLAEGKKTCCSSQTDIAFAGGDERMSKECFLK